MNIKFNDLQQQISTIRTETDIRLNTLFEKCDFINGNAVKEFEQNFANFIGTKYAIGVSNGTDAIKLAIESLSLFGKTAIYIPANTFIATIIGAEMAMPDASLKLIDCDEYYQIDVEILRKKISQERHLFDNVIIIPVHLYGHTCDMNEIVNIAKEYDCKIVEDSAQAHGSICENEIKSGAVGDISAFSLYPGKNLGALGDGGIITTNSDEYYEKLLMLRNWGSRKKYIHEIKGYNNRLDTIQAIFLDEKLKHLEKWNENRNIVASLYDKYINNERIIKPKMASYCEYNTYHIYPIRTKNRDGLSNFLQENGIPTIIHYPIPIELSEPYFRLNAMNYKTRDYAMELLSLPMHPFLTEEEVIYVCEKINEWND